jgi:probable phosphoglycerate mutase
MSDYFCVLLRHGATSWNVEGRIQGHSDIGLLPQTIDKLAGLRVPAPWSDMPWYTSPLKRTLQTAQALGLTPAGVLPAFIEMNWGRWEGQKLSSLRADLGPEMTTNEDRGWDFRPDGGESPRDVLGRVEAFLAQWDGGNFGVVAHKGLIRAIYARATGWNMMGKMPDKLHWDALHVFHWSAQCGLSVKQLNLALIATEGTPE